MELLLAIFSLAFSAIALYKSASAKRAVTKALDHRDEQEDLDRTINLVSDLKAAKDSATSWIPGMVDRQGGRDREEDIAKLHKAVDSLRTNPPLEMDIDLQIGIDEAAKRINDLAGEISENPNDGNLWKSAQSELQNLIRSLDPRSTVRCNTRCG